MLFFKYPRTYHFSWSEGIGSDDKVLQSVSHFINKEVVVTLKMDGENSSLYTRHCHARSIDSSNHVSRDWLKKFHAERAFNIPENWRICGENLYAKHSIYYQNLADYFLLFSIWDDKNYCLSWDETIEWSNLLDIKTVPVLYRGKWDEKVIRSLHQEYRDGDLCEGYVVRLADSFHYDDFQFSCAKYVRKNHVQTDNHWMNEKVIPNKLKGSL